MNYNPWGLSETTEKSNNSTRAPTLNARLDLQISGSTEKRNQSSIDTNLAIGT
jgi:hypothetical protein